MAGVLSYYLPGSLVEEIAAMTDVLGALLGSLGVGGVIGYAAGVAVKSIGKLIGCALGIVFILMQLLAYYGIAEWHWDAIGNTIAGPGADAARTATGALWKVLTYNLPFTGGFAAGFFLALRR